MAEKAIETSEVEMTEISLKKSKADETMTTTIYNHNEAENHVKSQRKAYEETVKKYSTVEVKLKDKNKQLGEGRKKAEAFGKPKPQMQDMVNFEEFRKYCLVK